MRMAQTRVGHGKRPRVLNMPFDMTDKETTLSTNFVDNAVDNLPHTGLNVNVYHIMLFIAKNLCR